jgi:hypothetical protein
MDLALKEHYLFSIPKEEIFSNIKQESKYNLSITPKQFSPLVVIGDEKELRRVYFKNENNSKSLYFKEEVNVLDDNIARVSYSGILNLKVFYDSEEITYQKTELNKIYFSKNQIGKKITVKYKLKDSFYIDENKIYFSNDYNSVKVIYESDENSPFYDLKKFNFNPYMNDYPNGYLFISDSVKEFKEIKVEVSELEILNKKGQYSNLKIKVLDLNNNPISNKEVNASCSFGSISFLNNKSTTDSYGNVYLIYELQTETSLTDTISVSLTDNGENYSFEIDLKTYNPKNVIYEYFFMVENKDTVVEGEKIQIKATVIDEKMTRIPGINIVFRNEKGTKSIETDIYGQAVYETTTPSVSSSESYRNFATFIKVDIDNQLLEDLAITRVIQDI